MKIGAAQALSTEDIDDDDDDGDSFAIESNSDQRISFDVVKSRSDNFPGIN